jgi:hypothetical protein
MFAWMVWLALEWVNVCIDVSPFIKSIYLGFDGLWMAGGAFSSS